MCFFGSVAVITVHSLNAFALSLLLLLRLTFRHLRADSIGLSFLSIKKDGGAITKVLINSQNCSPKILIACAAAIDRLLH